MSKNKIFVLIFLQALPILFAISSSSAFAEFIDHPIFGKQTWIDSKGLSWSPPLKDQDGNILVNLEEAKKICSNLFLKDLARLPTEDEKASLGAAPEYLS